MRPLVVVLLSFILATSYAKSIFDEDEPYEPYERDDLMQDELEKRVECRDTYPAQLCAQYKVHCAVLSEVRQYCKKTCNACQNVQPQCIDKDRRCPGWKSFCGLYSWARDICQATCGQCKKSPTRPTT